MNTPFKEKFEAATAAFWEKVGLQTSVMIVADNGEETLYLTTLSDERAKAIFRSWIKHMDETAAKNAPKN
jgi:hypothetical protein